MSKIQLIIPTNVPHISQIIVGFLKLKEFCWEIEVTDNSKNPDNPFYGLPVITAVSAGGERSSMICGMDIKPRMQWSAV